MRRVGAVPRLWCMGKTVDVIIPVEAELAGKLADPAMRARVAAVVNHELRFDREAFVRELGVR